MYLLIQTHKYLYTTTTAKSRQSCPTLCDPIDGSPPGSSVPGILQARILEWVAMSFSHNTFVTVVKYLMEEEMATYSIVLAWRIQWTEKPGKL